MNTAEHSHLPTVAILGLGSMGGAILHGMLAPGVDVPRPIRVTTKSRASAAALAETRGVTAVSTEESVDANRAAVRGSRVVMLGVKPWMIHDLLREISDDLEPGTLVVSIAAGITLDSMESLVRDDVFVIRAMPNTPSLVGRGITGLAAGSAVTESDLALVQALFETVGDVLVVESEAQLDALTAVSGSGPAYVFLFVEKFAAAAQRLGFSRDDALKLAQGTFLGATVLLNHTGEDPAELRRRVTSPNGTTEKAIEQFQAAGLDDAMDRALAAAITRSQEIAAD